MLKLGLRSRREKGIISADGDFSKIILQKQYKLEEILGQGTNAKVHKALDKKTKSKNKVVAVKIMKTKKEIEEENGATGNIDDELLFRHEIKIMLKIKKDLPKHPHIMELIQVCMSNDPLTPPSRPCLVLEYLSGGELFDKIVEKNYFTESDGARIFEKLIKTLDDLHSIGIVHRDLKPENIIYGSSENIIKICDFGTAKLMDNSIEDIFSDFKVGSPGYYAPETIYKNYHPANDIWSMGCILYTLLCGYMPFDMDDPLLIVKLMTCRYEFHEANWQNISTDAKDLISKMISKPYKERITAKEVLKHSWFVKMKKRPSQANLGLTLQNLKELNNEKEKKKQHMREYFFNNVLSARVKVTDLIANTTRVGANALKSMRSRGMSAISQLDMTSSSRNLRRKKSKKNIVLKHTKPKNRQELLSDIRGRRGHVELDEEEEEEFSERSRSKSTITQIREGMKKFSRRKKKKEPKNIQAMLSDIRTRRSVQFTENQVRIGGGMFTVDVSQLDKTEEEMSTI